MSRRRQTARAEPARARVGFAATAVVTWWRRPGASPGAGAGGNPVGDLLYRLCWNSNCLWLAGSESDDAPYRIVWRYANRHPVAWHHFDSEAAHPAAQLGQYFVAGVALHTVKSAAVYRHDSTLHINQIVLAQLLAFLSLNKHYAIGEQRNS